MVSPRRQEFQQSKGTYQNHFYRIKKGKGGHHPNNELSNYKCLFSRCMWQNDQTSASKTPILFGLEITICSNNKAIGSRSYSSGRGK